jgi:hypothetical protein
MDDMRFKTPTVSTTEVDLPRRGDTLLAPTQRSRVTNGKTLFAQGGDQRSPWARRLRDIMALHVADRGGPDVISEAQRSLIRRAGTLTVELERLEAKFATGQAAEGALDVYQRAANSLRRLLEAIGLDRVPKDVTDLPRYLAALQQADDRSAAALEGDDL